MGRSRRAPGPPPRHRGRRHAASSPRPPRASASSSAPPSTRASTRWRGPRWSTSSRPRSTARRSCRSATTPASASFGPRARRTSRGTPWASRSDGSSRRPSSSCRCSSTPSRRPASVLLVRHPVSAAFRRPHVTTTPEHPLGRGVLTGAYRAAGRDVSLLATDPPYLRQALAWRHQIGRADRWLAEHVPADRVLRLRLEEFALSPRATVTRLAAHLECPPQRPGDATLFDEERIGKRPDPRQAAQREGAVRGGGGARGLRARVARRPVGGARAAHALPRPRVSVSASRGPRAGRRR